MQHGGAVGVLGIDRVDGHAGIGHLGQQVDAVLDDLALVGLGQHQHRIGAAGADQHQVTFDAARVEVLVQPDHHQHVVDIRGDQLLAVVFAGGAALEDRTPRQQVDDGFAAFIQRDPVADRRALVGRETRPGPGHGRLHLHLHLVGAGGHVVGGAVLAGDARQAVAGGGGQGLARRVVVGPAEGAQGGEVFFKELHWRR